MMWNYYEKVTETGLLFEQNPEKMLLGDASDEFAKFHKLYGG